MTTQLHPESIDTSSDDFPSSGAIAIRTAATVELQSPADIQKAMQQMDEQQFLAEILGEALEKWFYSFKVGGKTVEGVSAAGAHEFARLRADQGFPIRFPLEGIRYEEASENGELGIRATIVARDYRTKAEAIGMAFYPHLTDRPVRDRDGQVIRVDKEFDRMAGRKAMSVAERNAILRLIPEKTVISALKVRARIVAENEVVRQEQAKLAEGERPAAKRIVAGSTEGAAPQPTPTTAAKPAASPAAEGTAPACPECGGEMWDNRASKKNPRSPDFKCRNAPPTRGAPGCNGVIWPPKDAELAI